MESLKLKDFLNYRFLSGVQYAPDGSKATIFPFPSSGCFKDNRDNFLFFLLAICFKDNRDNRDNFFFLELFITIETIFYLSASIKRRLNT